MKRRSKKLISLLVATGLLAGSLAGCGNSDKGSDPSSGSETGAEAGAENLSIVVSHQPYSHGLPSYIGEQEGTFSDAGLDMEILWFSGGAEHTLRDGVPQKAAVGADCRILEHPFGRRGVASVEELAQGPGHPLDEPGGQEADP